MWWWSSLQSAERWADGANIALVLALLVGVIATYLIVKTTNVKERYWAESRETSQLRITQLESEASKAQAVLGKANADIAKAHVAIAEAQRQAASLEKEAAEARLEQERLKQIVSWRVLSKEAGEKLVQILSHKKELITLSYVAADPEVLGLAIQFSKVFEAAQWQIFPSSMTFSSQLVFDIRLPGPENETVRFLRDAFTQAQVPFLTEDVPPSDMAIVRSGQEKPSATLFIGSKRPPF
jgi:hypothetical protein